MQDQGLIRKHATVFSSSQLHSPILEELKDPNSISQKKMPISYIGQIYSWKQNDRKQNKAWDPQVQEQIETFFIKGAGQMQHKFAKIKRKGNQEYHPPASLPPMACFMEWFIKQMILYGLTCNHSIFFLP